MSMPEWNVVNVTARDDCTLLLTFQSGERRVYDARPLLLRPIYSRLGSLPFFLSARAECGTVVWSDDCDIAPEHLYECSVPVEEGDMRKIPIPKFLEGEEMTQEEFNQMLSVGLEQIERGETISMDEVFRDFDA